MPISQRNVSAIVIELPIRMISEGRRRLAFSGFTIFRDEDGNLDGTLDRIGNPFVLGGLLPLDQRDRYNRSLPEDDLDFRGLVLDTLTAFGASEKDVRTLESFAFPDTLKVDLERPIAYPNGRHLADDVIDTLLALMFDPPLSDGVNENDKPFERTFPYLALPHHVP